MWIKRNISGWCSRTYAKINAKLPDADVVWAYDTIREVRVLDRRLGLVYWLVTLLVIFYIVIGVFIINQKHLDSEKSMGWILSHVLKSSWSTNLGKVVPWDVYDMVTNPGEQGAVFIPTRIVITKGQTQAQGFCQSPLHTCATDNDCDIGNEELQRTMCMSGQCMRRQWCPAENPNATTSEVHLLNFDHTELWLQTYVHFHRFLVDVATTDEHEPIPYPAKGANTFAVKDLMRMANLKPEEVQENGAIMILNSVFKCDLDEKDCETHVESANIDTKSGFNHVHNHYYWKGGARTRDSYRLYGIRIVAFATGIGTRTSFSMIVLQLSSALALLGTARTAADFVLMNLVPERRHYTDEKILHTEDFND